MRSARHGAQTQINPCRSKRISSTYILWRSKYSNGTYFEYIEAQSSATRLGNSGLTTIIQNSCLCVPLCVESQLTIGPCVSECCERHRMRRVCYTALKEQRRCLGSCLASMRLRILFLERCAQQTFARNPKSIRVPKHRYTRRIIASRLPLVLRASDLHVKCYTSLISWLLFLRAGLLRSNRSRIS